MAIAMTFDMIREEWQKVTFYFYLLLFIIIYIILV
jgi:hypothetical protein